METFSKELAELKKLNLPKDKYAVFGSGPLAIRGIRDSEDLDIVVKPELWNELVKKYPKENEKIIRIGSIEIFKNWLPWLKDVNELIDDSDIFDGQRFVKIKYILIWKKSFNREKDRKDIKLIENYLGVHKKEK